MNIKDTIKIVFGTSIRLFLGYSTEPGLRIFGKPNENSPVFVTCNFALTVKRVSRYLKNLDCYLLVCPSKGINVWCAACGGIFNAHSIISVIKTSGIGEEVRHRTLILPQLSAPGIDTELIRRETGWHSKFGPVYAKDIPEYLKNGFKKTEEMRRTKFPLSARLELAMLWALPVSIILAIPFAIWWRGALVGVIGLVWGLALAMCVFYFRLPGKIGIQKAMFVDSFFIIGIIVYSLLVTHWSVGTLVGWCLGSVALAIILGFDFEGSSGIHASDTVAFYARKWPWIMKIWSILGFEFERFFTVMIDSDKCKGCGTCVGVCPQGVYAVNESERKSRIVDVDRCQFCTACIKQCPTGAISTNPPIKEFIGIPC